MVKFSANNLETFNAMMGKVFIDPSSGKVFSGKKEPVEFREERWKYFWKWPQELVYRDREFFGIYYVHREIPKDFWSWDLVEKLKPKKQLTLWETVAYYSMSKTHLSKEELMQLISWAHTLKYENFSDITEDEMRILRVRAYEVRKLAEEYGLVDKLKKSQRDKEETLSQKVEREPNKLYQFLEQVKNLEETYDEVNDLLRRWLKIRVPKIEVVKATKAGYIDQLKDYVCERVAKKYNRWKKWKDSQKSKKVEAGV